jgi:hypothetical protein
VTFKVANIMASAPKEFAATRKGKAVPGIKQAGDVKQQNAETHEATLTVASDVTPADDYTWTLKTADGREYPAPDIPFAVAAAVEPNLAAVSPPEVSAPKDGTKDVELQLIGQNMDRVTGVYTLGAPDKSLAFEVLKPATPEFVKVKLTIFGPDSRQRPCGPGPCLLARTTCSWETIST